MISRYLPQNYPHYKFEGVKVLLDSVPQSTKYYATNVSLKRIK